MMRSLALLLGLAMSMVALSAVPSHGAITIASTAITNESTNTNTHSFHTGFAVSGEMVVMIIGCRGATNSVTWPQGVTELEDSNTSTALLSVGWIRATGSMTNINNINTAVSDTCTGIAYRVSGAHTSQAPEKGTAVGDGTGANDSPDPPSLTPSWSDALQTLYIAAAGIAFNTSCNTYPSGFSNTATGQSSGATPGAACAATLLSNSPPVNPSNFVLNSVNSWVANTIAVRAAGTAADAILGNRMGTGGIVDSSSE